MRLLISFCTLFLINTLWADSAIHFKTELISHVNWLSYGAVLLILLGIVIYLITYSKMSFMARQSVPIFKKITLDSKTKIYIVDYQHQQFLVATNQHALAIHSLSASSSKNEL